MAGTIVVDRIESDSSYTSTINVASKVNFTGGMQIGGQDTTFGSVRNRIINGDMRIHQRGGTITATGLANTYGVDRFAVRTTSGSAEVSMQQSTAAPDGFYNSLLCTVTSADASLTASDLTLINHKIEGVNTSDLGWGTATAQPITISFRVRSSLVGTYGVGVQNNDSNRSYPSTYTINQANTWETKTITIPGDTTGTWNAGSTSTSIYLWFGLAAASGISGTANTWVAADYRGTTGQVNWCATLSNTFYLTGVQLEKGSSATAFEYRQFGQELALCQRYFISYGGTTGYERFAVGICSGTTTASVSTFLPVPMRIAPSLSYSALANFGVYDGGNVFVLTGFALDQPSTTIVSYTATVASGLTQYRPGIVLSNNTSAARLQLSSEL